MVGGMGRLRRHSRHVTPLGRRVTHVLSRVIIAGPILLLHLSRDRGRWLGTTSLLGRVRRT